MFAKLFARIKSLIQYIRENRFDRSLMRYFDWPLLIMVLTISLFGIVCIFSATSSEVSTAPSNLVEMLQTQSIAYPRLQFLWLLAGMVAMFAIIFFPYALYGRYAHYIYVLNIAILLFTLVVAKAGRGAMKAFLSWGSSSERGLQTSEFGKVFMIMCFAKVFSDRKRPIRNLHDILWFVVYLMIPLVLIVIQPDVGTALVYAAVFCVMVFVSGTDYKLIASVLGCAVLLIIPVWYFMNNTSSSSFRLERILMWLHPEDYPDEARQIINGQIAIGSGGLWGKGVVSPGSFASLGYISDDHTDFIFAIVCESFGLVGGCALVLGYILLLGRLLVLSNRVSDPYGSYLIIGVFGMLLFHIIENICMVIGLLPVTGIPLPFVSYGGSNMLTNMMAIGLVENVVMRSRARERRRQTAAPRSIDL